MQAPAQAHSRLEHFPIGLFAIVMGLAGLTLATLRLEHAAGAGRILSPWALGLTIAVFLFLLAAYAAKALRFPAAVKADWNHPVKIAFFPAISIGMLLISTAMVPLMPAVAGIVWGLGAVLHLAGTLAVVSSWIGHRKWETVQMSPAWFIPAVGNVIVPVAGARLGYTEISWFFFTTGILFWMILLTLVFNRLIFHAPLPERLYPTLMILVAPPAVCFVAWHELTGDLNPFARVLYYGAVLFALVVAAQIGKLVRLPFVISWWAYSFPVAALTIATFLYGEASGKPGFITAGYALYAVLAAVIAMLIMRTLSAAARGLICQPE
ncbi:MAG: SLAC1 anion channel family protein [Notoacmeibacter sp.]|nr:SLAC1 anion channel family protein [Notoacmeibacter sp.]MCC0032832.1 SLAC1 anion channel family protein [Brucellaceae bacterium]